MDIAVIPFTIVHVLAFWGWQVAL